MCNFTDWICIFTDCILLNHMLLSVNYLYYYRRLELQRILWATIASTFSVILFTEIFL